MELRALASGRHAEKRAPDALPARRLEHSERIYEAPSIGALVVCDKAHGEALAPARSGALFSFGICLGLCARALRRPVLRRGPALLCLLLCLRGGSVLGLDRPCGRAIWRLEHAAEHLPQRALLALAHLLTGRLSVQCLPRLLERSTERQFLACRAESHFILAPRAPAPDLKELTQALVDRHARVRVEPLVHREVN